jgi:hypothetical protein
VSAPYRCTWAYPDGNPHTQEFSTFEEARRFQRQKRDRGILVHTDGDGAEHDGERWHDGLTEDERDQL